MRTGKEIVTKATSATGAKYVFGAKAIPSEKIPNALDCSGLVAWTCRSLGVKMVDGSVNQFDFCKKAKLETNEAAAKITPGCLVFMAVNGKIHHVGISDGMGNTVEARGKAYGVGKWKWRRGWNLFAKIPGVSYE